MARYLTTAARYTSAATQLFRMLPDECKPEGAELIARLVNAGVVSCPRGVQGTVRLNIVKEVTSEIPIRCALEEREVNPDDPTDTRTYKALVTYYHGEE